MSKCQHCGDAPHKPNACWRDNCGESEMLWTRHELRASAIGEGNFYTGGAIFTHSGNRRIKPIVAPEVKTKWPH